MSVPIWARKGAKVVCVNAGAINHRLSLNAAGLEKGATYTIRDVVKHQHIDEHGVRLEEISRPLLRRDLYEQPFCIARFRPAVPPKTLEQDIAQFLPILKHQHAPEAVE